MSRCSNLVLSRILDCVVIFPFEYVVPQKLDGVYRFSRRLRFWKRTDRGGNCGLTRGKRVFATLGKHPLADGQCVFNTLPYSYRQTVTGYIPHPTDR